jgi:hypothetical protein
MRERPEQAGDRTSSVPCSVRSTGDDSPPPSQSQYGLLVSAMTLLDQGLRFESQC